MLPGEGHNRSCHKPIIVRFIFFIRLGIISYKKKSCIFGCCQNGHTKITISVTKKVSIMRNIILFDSDLTSVQMFQDLVNNELKGYKLISNITQSQALQACIENKPVLIIIDMHGAGIHGITLCRNIREEIKLKNTPLLVITDGKSKTADRVSFHAEYEPDYILYKPLDEFECIPVLKILLRLGTLEQLVHEDHKELNNKLIIKETELQNVIQDNERSKEQLSIERDFANQVLNAMGQGLTITNSDGIFIYINPAYSRMIGYQPEELLGSGPLDVTFEEDKPVLKEARKTRKKGQTNSYETRIVHKDGSLINVMITGVPYYKGGMVAGTIAVITDISYLKKTERRLLQLSEDYEHILNETQTAIFLIRVLEDHSFRFILNNRPHQIQTGITLDMLAGKTPEQLLGPEAGRQIAQNYERCVSEKKVISYEEEEQVITSTKRIWYTTLSPVIKDNKVVHIVGSTIDITKWKKNSMHL